MTFAAAAGIMVSAPRCCAAGSAPGLGPGGRRFESCHLDHAWPCKGPPHPCQQRQPFPPGRGCFCLLGQSGNIRHKHVFLSPPAALRRAVFSAIMAVAPARAAHRTQNENGVPVPAPARRFPKRRKEKEEWMKNRLLPSGLGPGSLFRVVPCGTLISYP